MPRYTETDFEDHIEGYLNQSGYESLQSTDYDKSLCLIPDETLKFIQGHTTGRISETGTPVRRRHTPKTHAPYQQPD